MSIPDDDHPDCYHEPLNPDQQAIFNYQMQIESGEYEPGEITIRQPTPEDWKSFELASPTEGTRRSRRRPPPAKPTGRHIKDAHHPQPLKSLPAHSPLTPN